MNKEDKELLLKDLCARLPYDIVCEVFDPQEDYEKDVFNARLIQIDAWTSHCYFWGCSETDPYKIERVKPYLRPISSMTDEEKKSYHIIKDRLCEACIHGSIKDVAYWTNSLDLWFYEYHFDNANLIEKGLALEAPEDMYKTK